MTYRSPNTVSIVNELEAVLSTDLIAKISSQFVAVVSLEFYVPKFQYHNTLAERNI